eukprot:CAMPEP_0174332926 /NCGR_PEP_ID=MMETSP0810-20121108/18704_1 /TAXON_ID=73025 ORGANISM="Eutreptiella gymnastica-like, Strain CCMP1594" /NCGR_SAMPLE_ID=MMETSP0810 /ASSEMBLY_ACC=CAM_ASM_000659 /LENGTH=50 /DNA_ID=CAMNT_0015449659 /DNA_START=383 /DNA_END=535 /DNA_ORIENTATION=-
MRLSGSSYRAGIGPAYCMHAAINVAWRRCAALPRGRGGQEGHKGREQAIA